MQLALFGLNGAFAAAVYSAVVWTLIAASPDTFALDVVIAFAASAVANYVGARVVFKPHTTFRGHILRYLIVVACTFTATGVIAALVHDAGAPDIVGAYLPTVLTAIPTFVVMRTWVFRRGPA